jgi:hypothetical protein
MRETAHDRTGASMTTTSEQEARAEAVREAKRYIDSIHRNGLVPLATVLADLEAVAYRMSQGMTARGNTRQTTREPTEAEVVEAMRQALNDADVDYSAREQRADAGGGDMEPGDWFTFLAHAALTAARQAGIQPIKPVVTSWTAVETADATER